MKDRDRGDLVRAFMLVLLACLAACKDDRRTPTAHMPRLGELVTGADLRNGKTLTWSANMPAIVEVSGNNVCVATPSRWTTFQRNNLSTPALPRPGQELVETTNRDGSTSAISPHGLVVHVTDEEMHVATEWVTTWVDWTEVVAWSSMPRPRK